MFTVFISACLLCIAFSFLPERWLKPQAPTCSAKAILLQALLVSVFFFAVTLLVQRPIFSGLAVSIFLIILSGVSNAKFRALKEPMVFSDITMFSQAFKHPRLYFPFLGLWPVILMPVIIIGLIYTVLTLEPAMLLTLRRLGLTLMAIGILGYAAKLIALNITLTEDPAKDNANYGLLNTLFIYSIQADTAAHKQSVTNTLKSSVFTQASHHNDQHPPPHLSRFFQETEHNTTHNITVIQSESFFDARRMHPSITHSVLSAFDQCKQESSQHGKLKVPAWGANTMRTEFSFLTGLKYQQMGLYRYYPYQYLHNMPVVSLASLLQSQGYHCVCIHPHPASFFGRDRIFPKMGFDEFIDIKDFDTTHTFGPYISDEAVTNKITEVTERHNTEAKTKNKPLFIFAITMENHGPLHLEKASKEEQKHYYDCHDCYDDNNKKESLPLTHSNDLTVYLRHLKNADQMINTLTDHYRQSNKPTTLCFYGDHIPSMPKIYQQLSYTDGDSDYFIWQNTHSKKIPLSAKDTDVDCLAETLLKITGNIK